MLFSAGHLDIFTFRARFAWSDLTYCVARRILSACQGLCWVLVERKNLVHTV